LVWFGLLLPTLPLYIEDVGATKQQIGLVMADLCCYSFFAGALADQPAARLFADWHGCSSDRTLGVHGSKVDSAVNGDRAFTASVSPLLLPAVRWLQTLPRQNRGEVIGHMSW